MPRTYYRNTLFLFGILSFSTMQTACPADEPATGTDSGQIIADAATIDAAGIDAGQVADDAGQVADDAGQVADDAGQVADDAGQVADDAGQVAGDAGQVADDAGQVAGDAGQVADDAGQVADDAGQVADDAGQVADDAGQVADDAGQVADDAGQVEDATTTTDAASEDTFVFVNHAPSANAGADQLDLPRGSAQQLDGTGSSDPDPGQTLTYTWSQVSGPTTTLSDVHSATPGITMPNAYAELVFELVVNDGFVDSSADSVRLTTANSAPVAVIDTSALQPVARGLTVQLDGSNSSDADGDTLTYAWQQTAGTTLSLSDATVANPTFTSPALTGDLTFSLTVSDDFLTSDPVEVVITVYNTAPVAKAGADQNDVDRGATVQLDGTSSTDSDSGDTLTYAWTQTAGATVNLDDASSASPSFSAPIYPSAPIIFNLVVSDGLDSDSDSVQISVVNSAPVVTAQSGDCSANKGDTVALHASASDADGDSLSYAWAQNSGPTVSLSNADTTDVSYTAPDKSGDVLLQVVASDLQLDSTPQEFSCTILNRDPVAEAGADQIDVARGATVQLDGSASSDPDSGDTLTYAWTQIEGPAVTFDDDSNATPSFTMPDSSLSLTFNLTVTDDDTTPFSSSDIVTISPANAMPVFANASVSMSVNGGEQILLDGRDASDADGDMLYYQWQQISGAAQHISHADRAVAAFVAPLDGASALQFDLQVSDGALSAHKTVTVDVQAYSGSTLTTTTNPFIHEVTSVLQSVTTQAIDGDTLYVGTGFAIYVFDVSDPFAPTLLSTANSSSCTGLEVSGTLLHCSASNEKYEIYDVSDPAAINRIAQLDLSGEGTSVAITDIAVYGHRAYFPAGSKTGVLVVDFSTPSSPTVSGRWYDADVDMLNMNRITVSGDGQRLYVADKIRGLKVFDLSSDPDNPSLLQVLSRTDLGGTPCEAKAQGDRVYVDLSVSGACQLTIFDLSNSASPLTLGSVEHGCYTDTKYLSLQGEHATLAGYNSLLTRFDISDETNPQIIAQFTAAQGYRTSVEDASGKVIFAAADGGRRLAIYDLSDPMGRPAASLTASNTVNNVFAQGAALYVADSAGLSMYSADPANNSFGQIGSLSRSAIYKVIARRGLVFARRSSALESYDFRTPAQAVMLDSLSTAGSVYDLALSPDGQTAYVADYNAGLSLVDITDAQNMTMISTASTSESINKVCIEDDNLYGLHGSYNGTSLFAFDISDPSTPNSLLDAADSVSFYIDAQAMRDAMIYVASSQASGFDYVDVSDPAAPIKKRYNNGIRAKDLKIFGRQLYAATNYNGLLVYDIGDSNNIHWIAQFDNQGYNNTLSMDWPWGYVGLDSRVDAFALDTLQLDTHNVTLPLSSAADYDLHWRAPASGADVELQCDVSAGTCEISSIDQTAHTATVRWNTPDTATDAEILIRLGNQHFFTTASDRVSISG